MADLVFLLHQVQLWRHALVVFELRLPHREQMLDRVLHPLVDLPLVQNALSYGWLGDGHGRFSEFMFSILCLVFYV